MRRPKILNHKAAVPKFSAFLALRECNFKILLFYKI